MTGRDAMLERFHHAARSVAALLFRGRNLAAGALLGALFVLWWTHALVSFGGTRSILTGLVSAAVLAGTLGFVVRSRCSTDRHCALTWCGLAAWTAILPLVSRLVFRGLSLTTVDALSHPAAEFLAGFVSGCVLLALPHFGLALLWHGGAEESSADSQLHAIRPHWFGLVLSLLLTPAWLLPSVGVPTLTLAAILGAVAIGLLQRMCTVSSVSAAQNDHDGEHQSNSLISAGLSGALLALAVQVTSQLWIHGLVTAFTPLAGWLLGTAVARRFPGLMNHKSSRDSGAGVGLFAAACAVLLAGCEPLWTGLCLWWNSHVTSVGWLFSCRIGLGLLLALPAGIAFGWGNAAAGPTSRSPATASLLGLFVGWAGIRWGCVEPTSASVAIMIVGLLHSAIVWLRSGRVWPRSWWLRTSTVSALGVLSATPLWLRQNHPDHAARLLFSSKTAHAARTSSNHDLLLALDDARLQRIVAGADAVWTSWRQRGEITLLRENGLPQGESSRNLSIAPEPAAELLAAALPLTIHPQADHVLVVGLGGGAVVRGALETPLQSLTCWEQDADLLGLVETEADESAGITSDPRVTLTRIHPALASAARQAAGFDVILLNERQFSCWRTLGQGHAQAYARWRDLLQPDGLLCQRFEYVNYGSRPLLDITRTLSQVFPQVLLWESAPGEMLLLASRSEQPLIDSRLVARFEAPQTRRLLGRIGWDCSQPLNIVTITGEELQDAASIAGVAATSANAHFEFSLPIEAARWGNKSQELQRQLAPLAKSALSRLPPESGQSEMQKRLEDVLSQRQVVTNFPDHYWAYRKTLKERLQVRPRSLIVQMKHELHPDDERRQQYLEALGAAATAAETTPEQLQQVAQFAEPYDPLVTPFLHRELAQLCPKSVGDAAAMELEHWLHSVYYSPGYDRSIRDATAALRVLLEHPETLAEPAQRWDHMNSLLEILKERWTLRSQQATGSRYEAADMAETMDVTQRALDELRTSAAAAGIDPDWAAIRVRVLDRTFVRALRSHHAQQLARQAAMERQQDALQATRSVSQ